MAEERGSREKKEGKNKSFFKKCLWLEIFRVWGERKGLDNSGDFFFPRKSEVNQTSMFIHF